MGVYNTFGERSIQLKVESYEDLQCKHYRVGDEVKLGDGIYVGYEGVVVILDGIFVAEFDGIWDKWGGFDSCLDDVLEERNPVNKAMAEFEQNDK